MEDKKTIEESFSLIEEIINKLQNPETSLTDAFNLYEEGMKEVKFCNGEIDGIEKKIRILSGEDDE